MASTRFRIIVQCADKKYHPADISINSSGSALYYFPSKKILVGRGTLVPAGREVDHLSLKPDGKTHARDIYKNKYSGPQCNPTKEIGYQTFLTDYISNFDGAGIPCVKNLKKSDCILPVSKTNPASGIIHISLFSGRLIDCNGQVHLQRVDELITQEPIIRKWRSIASNTENADQMVLIALYSCHPSPNGTGIRKMDLHNKSNIKRPGVLGYRDNGTRNSF